MQHHARQKLAIRRMPEITATDRAGLGLLRVDAERRNADRLAGLDAGVGFGARAIDANLAGAQEFLQRTEAQPGKVHLEPAVETHAGLVTIHLSVFYTCHLSEPAFRFRSVARQSEAPAAGMDARKRFRRAKAAAIL